MFLGDAKRYRDKVYAEGFMKGFTESFTESYAEAKGEELTESDLKFNIKL